MSGRPATRLAYLMGLAVGGVLAGHELTYGLLEPSEHGRRAALATTGHGYLATANRLALTLAVAGLAASVLARLFRGAGAERGVGWLALRLIPVQMAAFGAMEIVERVVAGAPLHDLGHILPVGLGIQLALAMVAAAGLRFLWRAVGRAAEVLGDAAAPPARPALVVALPAPVPPLRIRIGAARPPSRAPPFVR